MRSRVFRPADRPAVVALWQVCELTRPWNDPTADIARKVARDDDMFLVGIADEEHVVSMGKRIVAGR